MESVVKPVDSAKICVSREDASGEIESGESETQRVGPEKDREGSSRSRKRRYSSEERHRDGDRNQKENHVIGSRYWGEEDAPRSGRGYDDRYGRDGRRNYRNDDRENGHRDSRKSSQGEKENRGRGGWGNVRDSEIDRVVDPEKEEKNVEPRKRKEDDQVTTKTGGAYIPPARLRMMQEQITDKNSVAYQRLSWEALKKSIHGLINKVNIANIADIVRSLFKENIIRGRGLLSRSIIQAQTASPTFTHVYAALASIINSKFPETIGKLILTRLILQFRRGFRRNDKQVCLSSTRFIAHLVNQQMAHEVLALEILTLLLENATDDSVEVAVGFLKECGQKLGEVSPRALTLVFDRLRHVLHEADLDKRVKYMIEVMFQVRKDGFKDNPAVLPELDLVPEEDQITHDMSISEEQLEPQDLLNVFKHDPDYEANEEKYQSVKREILGEECDEDDDNADEDESDESGSEEEEKEEEGAIIDETETNLTALRRTIYLTVQSSLDHNECAHKMMKLQLKPGQESEICHMILDCCAQQRTYEKFFGLLAQRFCQINKIYVPPFEQIFRDTYDTIHRLDTNKLRNVGKMFAHLLFTDAISWMVLQHIRLTEEATTSSSRIFLKILFQELAEYMGLAKLNERLKDGTLQAAFEGVFPRDDPCNTRFAINFFTSIGLGGLTDELREHLRTHPKPPPVTVPAPVSTLSAAAAQLLLEDSDADSSSSSSSSSTSSSSSSSSSSSDSSSDSSEDEDDKRKKKKYSYRKGEENRTKKKSPANRVEEDRRRTEGFSTNRDGIDNMRRTRRGSPMDRNNEVDGRIGRKSSISRESVEDRRSKRRSSTDRRIEEERRSKRRPSSDRDDVEDRGMKRKPLKDHEDGQGRRMKRGSSTDRDGFYDRTKREISRDRGNGQGRRKRSSRDRNDDEEDKRKKTRTSRERGDRSSRERSRADNRPGIDSRSKSSGRRC